MVAIIVSLYLIHVDLSSVTLQFCAHGLQESSSARAIHNTVIKGQTEIHHVADGNRIILSYHWPLDYRIHTQNTCMRLVDNRHRDNRAESARIIYHKGAI